MLVGVAEMTVLVGEVRKVGNAELRMVWAGDMVVWLLDVGFWLFVE